MAHGERARASTLQEEDFDCWLCQAWQVTELNRSKVDLPGNHCINLIIKLGGQSSASYFQISYREQFLVAMLVCD